MKKSISNAAIDFALLAESIYLQQAQGLLPHIPKVIFACVGSPSFHADLATIQAAKKYWSELEEKVLNATCQYRDSSHFTLKLCEKVIETEAAVDYGDDPCGDIEPRTLIAKKLTNIHKSKVTINFEDVIFTVGATSGLNTVLSLIQQDDPTAYIATPFPYYWIYKGKNQANNLHPIHVMAEPGYKLTSQSVSESLRQAKIMSRKISAFLFCDPNNPLGTVTSSDEWGRIATILKQYPNVPIVLDLSYSGMQLNGEAYVSLLEVDPSLKNNIIIIHSGTKGASFAGERLAFLVIFNKVLNQLVKSEIINSYIHAPRSLQYAYAHGFCALRTKELKLMNSFYKIQFELVNNSLKKIGLAMKDPHYKVGGGFYILADFSEFLNVEVPLNLILAEDKKNITTIASDVDIAYYLLYKDGIALAPLSYFGLNSTLGLLRITCSNFPSLLSEMMFRLEKRCIQIRIEKYNSLHKTLPDNLSGEHKTQVNQLNSEFSALMAALENKELLEQIPLALQNLLSRFSKLVTKSISNKTNKSQDVHSGNLPFFLRRKTNSQTADRLLEVHQEQGQGAQVFITSSL